MVEERALCRVLLHRFFLSSRGAPKARGKIFFSLNLKRSEFKLLFETCSLLCYANTRSPSTQSNQFIIMSTAKKENPKVTRAEKELMTAKDELEILKEAKPLSATCGELTEFSEREEEPFSATHVEANAWHKSEGGGCIIL